MLDRLVDPPDGIFGTKQKALMFAAGLGWYRHRRTPVERKGTAIRIDIFEKALDDGFINALAVAEKGDLKILGENAEEERASIFEEYAHTGLIEIRRRCFEQAGDPLSTLVELVDEVREKGEAEIPGLDPGVLKGLTS